MGLASATATSIMGLEGIGLVRQLFLRGLAAIYVVAFVAALRQFWPRSTTSRPSSRWAEEHPWARWVLSIPTATWSSR